MNIHLIANEKFTDRFTDFIDSRFVPGSNLVYVYDDGSGFKCEERACVKLINSFMDVDLSLIDNYGKLFIHGFYNRKVIRFLFDNYRKLNERQLVLIAWGADIYDSRFLLQDRTPHIRTWFYEKLKTRIVKKCKIFMTFACADIDIIRKYYGGNGKQFDCLYPSNVNIELLDKLKKENILNESESTRILLGNSATVTNNHIEALSWLRKFSKENIEIVCPLSYGDSVYGQMVIDAGNEMFGEKFIPLLEYMSPEEYSKLLNSVDIALFNHNRQQGTGNIEILAYLGKKLYLRSDTTTWEHYVKRDECSFFDTLDICKMTFEQFIHITEEEKSNNELYFKRIWDVDYVKSLWDDVIGYGE